MLPGAAEMLTTGEQPELLSVGAAAFGITELIVKVCGAEVVLAKVIVVGEMAIDAGVGFGPGALVGNGDALPVVFVPLQAASAAAAASASSGRRAVDVTGGPF